MTITARDDIHTVNRFDTMHRHATGDIVHVTRHITVGHSRVAESYTISPEPTPEVAYRQDETVEYWGRGRIVSEDREAFTVEVELLDK